MGKFVLALIVILSSYFANAQEVSVSTSFAESNSISFDNAIGTNLGYHFILSDKSKIGLSVLHSWAKNDYQNSMESDSQIHIHSSALRFSTRLGYMYTLINTKSIGLYIGPEISLNSYLISQQTQNLGDNQSRSYTSSSNTEIQKKRLPGAAINTQLCYKNFLHDCLELFVQLHPEVTSFINDAPELANRSNSINWLEFQLGFHYKFK